MADEYNALFCNKQAPHCTIYRPALGGFVVDATASKERQSPMLHADEVAEERSVEHLDYKVHSPDGWVKVTHVCRTIPMDVWRLSTNSFTLECAHQHLVETASQEFMPADRIEPGMLVVTELGLEAITESRSTGRKEELFDLRVDSPNHRYFTSGISSHNSTGIGAAELFKLNILTGYRAIYLAPLKEHTKTFADKLMDLQRGSVFPPDYIEAKGYKNNMYYKESPKGGSLKIMHILTDPTKIRGNSAGHVRIDEAQDFDSEHLPEIAQVQKAFRDTKTTLFAGTSKDLDTCLEQMYQAGSQGVWHIRCSCAKRFHALDDVEMLPKMMSVDGLRCPTSNRLLNPMNGEFVHAYPRQLLMKQASFHLPQLIVPEYAHGDAFMDIWRDFKSYPYKKFLQEVMGIAVDSGISELTEADLKKCCGDHTFDQIQQQVVSGKLKFNYVFSGCDWGGSDWNPASRTKQSYTVHTVYGLSPDGVLHLIYARRYAGMNYQEIAGTIVEAHNRFRAFAIGTDNGGGSYYNAYLRDCGRIRTDRILTFNYTDTKLLLERIPHPEANLLSLHRSDSISALINDIKAVKLRWPRWDESHGFVMDCLNIRRNITETNSGRSIMRYVKHGARADDFMQSSNYAAMVKRIVLRESMIPNQQILLELGSMLGTMPASVTSRGPTSYMGGHISG